MGRNWIFQRSTKGSVARSKEGSGFIGIPIKKSEPIGKGLKRQPAELIYLISQI